MRLILKFFGQKFWLKNSFSKSTPNDPKREKRSPVLPIGRPAGPSGGPNLTGDRFFQFLKLQMIQNVKKKRSPVLPTGRSGPSGGPNLTGDRFFHLLDHLELIWKFFFQPKSFDQKKPFN